LLGVSNVHHAKPTKSGGGKSGGSTTEPVSTTPGIASVGTGASLHNGSVVLHTTTGTSGYLLTDSIRGASVTMDGNNHDLSVVAANATVFEDGDNAWGDGNKRTRATVAVDAHYGAANAWDYFAQNFGRLGIWGDGKGSTSYVHVGSSMSNAYWYRGAMYFGDGNNFRLPYVSLDIVAHEMSHGVTQATAGLIYSGESGGLNEATSDIFGTMAEHFANNPHDVPDYTIGEKLMKSGAIRYMYKPSLNGSAPDCYSAEVATMGPHAASGIGNHFFYLLAEGAVAPAGTSVSPSDLVCNGNTGLQGVGRDAAQRIWYQALTRYMTSGTSYAGARQATLQAAADLFGAGSIQQHTVAAAWSAVAVN
jgi:Zn-dependent metalloprotease